MGKQKQTFRQNFKNNRKQQQKPNKVQTKINEKKALIQAQKEQQKIERAAAITKAKAKRLEKTKIMSKKTKRGQPVMKDRIEYLLKKIQETKNT